MALPLQPPVEIPLGGGPDQSKGGLFRGPNVLEANTNGSTAKTGYLEKLRGYTRVPFAATTHGDTPDGVFVSVGTDHGELVLLGQGNVYSVAATGEDIDGAAMILRGPSLVGNCRVGTIHVTSLSEE